MDEYASHVPILAWAAASFVTNGSILELGCGDYSTPMLAQFGEVRVISTDEAWAKKYLDIADVRLIDSWDNFRVGGFHDLIFLDNEQHVKDRVKLLPMLLNHARVVVMHDWKDSLKAPECLWSRVYRRLSPYTWCGQR